MVGCGCVCMHACVCVRDTVFSYRLVSLQSLLWQSQMEQQVTMSMCTCTCIYTAACTLYVHTGMLSVCPCMCR